MNITNINQTNFKGYDARPLKGIMMSYNSYGLAEKMAEIGKKEGFDLFISENLRELKPPTRMTESIKCCEKLLWMQDLCTVLKDKINVKMKFDEFKNLAKFLNKDIESPGGRIAGGNLYFVKDGEEDVLFVGEDELRYTTPEHIKQIYGVKKIVPLPQMDYHIDLFVRPLDNKNILVADDGETLRVLGKGRQKVLEKLEKDPENSTYKTILNNINRAITKQQDMNGLNPYPRARWVKEALEEQGFNPISVPGRIYTSDQVYDGKQLLTHTCNYMNAVVGINPDGELYYITNKSGIDNNLGLTENVSKDLDFSFEKSFIESIAPYVKPEHIYFVNDDYNFVVNEMLQKYMGGIHCACTELPEEIVKYDKSEFSKNK